MEIRIQRHDNALPVSSLLKDGRIVRGRTADFPTWRASIPTSHSNLAADRGKPWSSSSFMAYGEFDDAVVEMGCRKQQSLANVFILNLWIFLA